MSDPKDMANILGTGHEAFSKKSGKTKKVTEGASKTSQSKSNNLEDIEQTSPEKGEENHVEPYLAKLSAALASSDEDGTKKFKNIFNARFCVDAHIDQDTKLKSTLEKSHHVSPREWMILTQKHFNEFGGHVAKM